MPEVEITRGGTLRMMDFISSDVFDPAITIHAGSMWMGMVQIYDYVNRYSENFELQGQMADIPEVIDELTTVYSFKPGINWQDVPPLNGRPFTAEDAVFGYERFREDNPEFTFGGRFSSIDLFEAIDERTMRVVTKAPFAPLLITMAEDNMVMVSPEAVDAFGDEGIKLHENQIGTGAFMPDGFEQGISANIKRNPNYWQEGKPYLDGIEVIQITDAAQREAAMISGQIDINSGWGMGTSVQAAEALKDQMGDDLVVVPKPLVGRQSTHLNLLRTPFQDPRVRRALHLATSRQAIQASGLGNHWVMGVVPRHIVPFGFSEQQLGELPGYREDKEEDLADAMALLDGAGLADGFSLEMIGSGPTAEVMQQNWQEIGVDASLLAQTIPEWITARVNGDFDIVQTAITETADPDQPLYGANHTDGTVNFGKLSDPEVDRLAELQRTTLDVAAREAITEELQLLLFDLSPQIWTFNFVFQQTLRSYVKDFVVTPGYQGWVCHDTWLDKA